MLAASAADVNAELALKRRKAALQGADDAGGNAGGMPVHSHHRAERLKPERMRQPLQEFVAAVMMDDSLADNCAKQGHAFSQPRRNTPAVKRKIGAACSSCHDGSIRFLRCRNVRRVQRFQQIKPGPWFREQRGSGKGRFGWTVKSNPQDILRESGTNGRVRRWWFRASSF